jgi:hypothetical protein
MDSHAETTFERYFSLEEAASLIPGLREKIAQAQQELREIRGEVVLYRRILLSVERDGEEPEEHQRLNFENKVAVYEEALKRWLSDFMGSGIIVRDFERGLVDFPYRAKSTGEEFFLCWRLEEDGLFYFHDVREGYMGRRPIALLPE